MSEVLNDLAAARSPRASSKFVFPWAFAPHIHTEAASSPISAKPTFLKFWSLANLIFTKIKTGIASNLKGILYFPRINTEYDSIEGTIKLYNNQVFIADNIKEVIPEYLMVLKGVIDCPDLPLNVSRSALQNDGFVNKISEYISKKVADKLSGMCKTKREDYEKYWDNISPFIKFGCLKDEKFCDKMKDAVLFKDIDGKYLTLKDCIEENKIV